MDSPEIETPPLATGASLESVLAGSRDDPENTRPHHPAQCFPPELDFELALAAGEARVTLYSDGTFALDPDGATLAKLLPIYAGETIVDMVAWECGTDRPWWLLRGIAAYLGDDELRRACWFGRPVRLVATPKEWLAMSGMAVCVLDWAADLRALFADVAEVVPETASLAKHLRRRLVEQTAPTFSIRVAA